MSRAGVPFAAEDLYKGRSIHDLSRSFYRSIMKHDLNDRAKKLPSWMEVASALKNISADDEKHTQMLLDLVATPINVLWPGFEHPPPTSKGILFHAAHSLKINLQAFPPNNLIDVMQQQEEG